MHDFAVILNEIEPPKARLEGETQYRVRQIPKTGHYFGRDSQGHPCLLLDSRDHTWLTPIRLALLEVQFAVACRITEDSQGERIQTLTSIVCRSSDKVIGGYFAHIAQTIVTIVGSSPASSEVAHAVRRLTELFQNLTRPTGRSVIGLFGELMVIHVSGTPQVAASAWRSTVDNRFDFSIENLRLEAKSTSGRARTHHFSREQCMPPDDTVGVLISMFIERSGGGLSLHELVERIEHQLDNDAELVFRLHATIAETLGNAAPEALSMRFDEHLARDSMQIYELAEVPAVRGELPPEVSQVHFRANINLLLTANRSELERRSKMARHLLPGRI